MISRYLTGQAHRGGEPDPLPSKAPFLLRNGLLVLVLCASMVSTAQDASTQQRAQEWADSVYRANDNRSIANVSKTLPVLDSALAVFLHMGDTCRAARINSWRSHCFDVLGRIDSALAVAQQALRWFRPQCDSLVLMSINVNLCNALIVLEEFDRVKEITEASLGAWSEAWPYSIARNGLYTDRAIALVNLGETQAALEAFRDVLRNARKEHVVQNEADALQNLSAIFGYLGRGGSVTANMDSSDHYQQLAMTVVRRMGDKNGLLLLYSNMGIMQRDRGNCRLALTYLDSAQALAQELRNLDLMANIANTRSECLFKLGMSDSAYKMLRDYVVLNDSLLNTEKVKAIADMQEKYESEKKAKEILGLKADNLESELDKSRVKRTRNIYLFIGIGVVVLAAGLWSRLRFVHRSRAAIQKEKDRSEELLLNILPEEVAEELKQKGEAEARLISHVTVLFTDFKGFTAMSEQLSPKDLVRDIHECFSAFDHIMARHGIEKIKTIGDAYMAAGGLPTPNTTHALDVVKAAFEIREFIAEGKAQKLAAGLPYFEIRIGIHTGPVVAGIVGVKKFAYDIWGDTVNTASRMESSGEVGQVNISEVTYDLLKDEPGLSFTPRGKVRAKGKGEMEMFFVGRS
ncbi:MAG: adenylate/guanylate cyclase domain-containing protein [Flavobacteriales bacterium]